MESNSSRMISSHMQSTLSTNLPVLAYRSLRPQPLLDLGLSPHLFKAFRNTLPPQSRDLNQLLLYFSQISSNLEITLSISTLQDVSKITLAQHEDGSILLARWQVGTPMLDL